MPPKRQAPPNCEVCETSISKYSCSQCYVVYCSVTCYKEHRGRSCNQGEREANGQKRRIERTGDVTNMSTDDEPLSDPPVLRPLTSLKWPYVPEESAYPDPLKRDDPKVLQLRQYEAIATSPAVRRILESKKGLPELLESIDKLRGRDREEALQQALGVTQLDVDGQAQPKDLGDDVLALREFAEAIEAAVRGSNASALGLNWGD